MAAQFNSPTAAAVASPSALAIADLNGDGNLDLVTSFYEFGTLSETQSGVTILLGNGTGQFATSKNYAINLKTPNSNYQTAYQQYLSFVNSLPPGVQITPPTGVSPNQLTPITINDVAVVDVNHDGKLDLITAGLIRSPQQQGILSVLLGDGAGGFSTATNTLVDRIGNNARGAASLAIADFNGDGNLDVATAADSSISSSAQDLASRKLVALLFGNGTGNFGNQKNISFSSNVNDVAVGDFNGDGRSDLAVGGVPEQSFFSYDSPNSDLTILLNDGTANFSSDGTIPVQYGSSSNLSVGDFNSDGKLDISYAGGYWVGEGTGNFTRSVSVFLYASNGLTAAGDFNGDGKLDLAVSGYQEIGISGNSGLSVLFGNGTGKYTSPTTLLQNPLLNGLAVGDFNKDGKADIAATSYSGLSVFLSAATPADTLVLAAGTIDASLQTGALIVDLSKGTLQVGGQTQKLSGFYRLVLGTEQSDQITGSSKTESLDGNAGNDVIIGLNGNDDLTGGLGSDTLTGGKGKDEFIFANGSFSNYQFTAFNRAMGVDKITDFERSDTIALYRDTFTAFTNKRISFASVATKQEAQKSKALITYIAKTGSLFYNQNRAAQGFGAGGQFADFTNGLTLSKANFSVVG